MSLKPIIKSAREALDNKDYDYALQLCTDALAFEPYNYFLLVFRAVALTNAAKPDLEASLQSYTKATRSQPDNPLAFQGIINLYDNKSMKPDERYHKAIEDLSILYSKQNEWLKHFDLKKKQLSLFKSEKRTEDSIKVLDWLSSPEAAEHYHLSAEQTTEYVKHQISLLEPFESIQITKEVDSARTRLNAEPVAVLRERAEVQAYTGNRLNEFYRRLNVTGKLYERLLKMSLSDFYEGDRSGITQELLSLPEATSLKVTLEDTSDDALSGSPSSILMEAKNDFSSSSFESVLKRESSLQESLRKWRRAFPQATFQVTQSEWRTLKFQATIALGWFDDAYALIPAFSHEELLSETLFEPTLQVLEQTRHTSEAVDLMEEQLMRIDPDTPALILRLIDALVRMKRFFEAQEYISAVKEAYNLDSDAPAQARLYFASGLVAWLQNRRTLEECLNEFLQALKADSSSSLYFFWVGKYYWRMEESASAGKALKCFTKALSLDADNLCAALLIAEVLLKRPELSVEGLNVVEVLRPFTTKHTRNRRLMYYLGVAHLTVQKQFIDAATVLQSALKAPAHSADDDDSDPPISDVHCLTFLAEAFLRSERFASAEKAFLRLQSEPETKLVGSCGLAAVYSRSEHFIDAVDVFDDLNDLQSDGILSQKIQIDKLESKLLLAKFYLSQARFRAAERQLAQCLEIPVQSEISIYWRLMSQVYLTAEEYKDCVSLSLSKENSMPVNPGLSTIASLANSFSSSSLKQATLCAVAALSVSQQFDVSQDWLQLAHCLLNAEHFDYAQAAAQNCLKNTKSTSIAAKCHHLMFLIADRSGDVKRAQHHLVRSLHVQESLSGWLELGAFYKRHGDAELAREALKRALAVDQESNAAAIQLAALDSDATATAAVLGLAQRDFAFQPTRFDLQSALIVAAADAESETRNFATLLLHLRNKRLFKAPANASLLSDKSAAELWQLVTESEPGNLDAWYTLVVRDGLDCEYLRLRPLNELAQSGWRGVTDPLAHKSGERTKQEVNQINALF